MYRRLFLRAAGVDGLNAKAAGDATFARKVQQSAIRVMTLKYEMGLAR